MDLIKNRKKILSYFLCQQSGKCCKADGFVYVNSTHIKNMAAELDISENEFRQKFVTNENGYDLIASPSFNQKCFLDCNNQCQVYKSRPNPCKSYPDWDSIWESEAALNKEQLMCKGLQLAIAKFQKSKQKFPEAS